MRSKFSHHRCEKENLQHQTSILMSETMWTTTTDTLVISIVNYRDIILTLKNDLVRRKNINCIWILEYNAKHTNILNCLMGTVNK